MSIAERIHGKHGLMLRYMKTFCNVFSFTGDVWRALHPWAFLSLPSPTSRPPPPIFIMTSRPDMPVLRKHCRLICTTFTWWLLRELESSTLEFGTFKAKSISEMAQTFRKSPKCVLFLSMWGTKGLCWICQVKGDNHFLDWWVMKSTSRMLYTEDPVNLKPLIVVHVWHESMKSDPT